eukprot:1492739-Prymnesium_polylepis.1
MRMVRIRRCRFAVYMAPAFRGGIVHYDVTLAGDKLFAPPQRAPGQDSDARDAVPTACAQQRATESNLQRREMQCDGMKGWPFPGPNPTTTVKDRIDSERPQPSS